MDNNIYFNGIDGESGKFAVDPLDLGEILGDAETTRTIDSVTAPIATRGLPEEIDLSDLHTAGWGVVFAEGTPDEVRRALDPLVAHRRSVVDDCCFKVFDYQRGETTNQWLLRHGGLLSDVEPTVVPGHLLLVGNPEEMPISFQSDLDMSYSVGRLWFDSAEKYSQYAESVVRYESSRVATNRREIVFWAPYHNDDEPTRTSYVDMFRPLSEGQGRHRPIAEDYGYKQTCLGAQDATKGGLLEILHRPAATPPPAFIFAASHGVSWRRGDPRQEREQGALLAQDWPGSGSLRPEHYIAAEDLANDACVFGSVMFLFGCFSAGTPSHDTVLEDPQQISDRPFVAALPQRLLSHPHGSALAVIGHVDRAWTCSIRPSSHLRPKLLPFRNLIARLLKGKPVGCATWDFVDRGVARAIELMTRADPILSSASLTAKRQHYLRLLISDARNYLLLGDPAVCIGQKNATTT